MGRYPWNKGALSAKVNPAEAPDGEMKPPSLREIAPCAGFRPPRAGSLTRAWARPHVCPITRPDTCLRARPRAGHCALGLSAQAGHSDRSNQAAASGHSFRVGAGSDLFAGARNLVRAGISDKALIHPGLDTDPAAAGIEPRFVAETNDPCPLF